MLQRTIDRLLGRKPQRKAVMWMQDHLPDAKWLQQHLPDAKWLQARLPDAKALPDAFRAQLPEAFRTQQKRVLNTSMGLSSPLWPTFIAAAGAGVAFWWWTQWARGKAEAEAREEAAIAEGALPETVMAHVQPPADAGPEPTSPSDARLAESVEDILEHRPPEGETSATALSAGAGLAAPLSDEAASAVDESLGVQGAAGAKPKAAPRKRKPPAAQPTTH